MQTKKISFWTIVSLLLFFLVNYVLQTVNIGSNPRTLLHTDIMATLLFGIPLILFLLHLRIGFYLLALIQLLYTFGYLNGFYSILIATKISNLTKLGVLVLIILTLLVNIYWFILAWQYRKATTKQRVSHYIKYRK